MKHVLTVVLLFSVLCLTSIQTFALSGSNFHSSSKLRYSTPGQKNFSISQDLLDETLEDDFHAENDWVLPEHNSFGFFTHEQLEASFTFHWVTKPIGNSLPLFILYHSWKGYC